MKRYSLKVVLGFILLLAISLLVSFIFKFRFDHVSFIIGGILVFASIGGQVFPHMAEANASTKALGNYVPKTKIEEKITRLNPLFLAACLFLGSTFLFF